jgi:hypothetical protein
VVERIKADKKKSHIYKKTSRHQLGLAFSQLKEYEKFTKKYSEASETELSLIQTEIDLLRKRMDQVNYRTIFTESQQTGVDLIAGMRKINPDEDYLNIAEMSVAFHLFRISSTYISCDKTPLSWWFGSFKNILAESTATGRGYQKNHMSLDSYKVCLVAWERAKISAEMKTIRDYAINEANVDLDSFESSLTTMLRSSYDSIGSSQLRKEDYSFTLEAKHN